MDDPAITLYRLEKALRLGRDLGYVLHGWAPWGSHGSHAVCGDTATRRTVIGSTS